MKDLKTLFYYFIYQVRGGKTVVAKTPELYYG